MRLEMSGEDTSEAMMEVEKAKEAVGSEKATIDVKKDEDATEAETRVRVCFVFLETGIWRPALTPGSRMPRS